MLRHFHPSDDTAGMSNAGQPISVSLAMAPAQVERDFLHLGEFSSATRSLTVNSRYLELDGQPWLPVMGEFHYARFPASEWEVELHKMRAGGVNVVASYVFWNHHEEIEGEFDWSGQRDLRRFVTLAQQIGLLFYLRPGPWSHGESRHGGFPDWLLADGPVRCNDTGYLKHVARFYNEIGEQLRGLMWCDGGPVIGVQLENEYDRVGPACGAEHISELKRLAIEAGMTVPLYTVTGWPTLDIPAREVIPVSGAYADGFWSGEEGPLPPSGVFLFNTSRSIGEMGNVGGTPATERIDKRHYPFFLAEAGGGMHVSYHRRPVLSTDDVAATTLVQIGSGATLYGYYMYHGGTNPEGKTGRLHETQTSGYPNDVPILAYDFRAPLGQYGQIRASYGRLRTLHLFLAAFGSELATMESVLADGAPADPADRQRLRVLARGAGGRGYVFVNNHVRHHPMPDFDNVQLSVRLGDHATQSGAQEATTFPASPTYIPSGAYFIWPIGQRIGSAVLRYATLQPLTRFEENGKQTYVCFSYPGIVAELCFEPTSVQHVDAPQDWISNTSDALIVRPTSVQEPQILRITDSHGAQHTIVILTRPLADHCYRAHLLGRDRIILCEYGLYDEADTLIVSAPHTVKPSVSLFPGDDILTDQSNVDGFVELEIDNEPRTLPAVGVALFVGVDVLHDNQHPPAVRMGPYVEWRKKSVPLAHEDEQFELATRVRLSLDSAVPTDQGRILLAIDYIGDGARLYADGKLVDDNFYDGEPWYVGVDRFARGGQWPTLEIRIIAARKDLPVFLEASARQRLTQATKAAELCNVELIWWRTSRVDLKAYRRPSWPV